MMRKQLSLVLAAAIAAGLAAAGPTVGAEEEVAGETSGNVGSIDAIASPHATANMLELAADYALQCRKYDKAIALCKKALLADDDDLDIHKSYALALEGKLDKTTTKDTSLFNQCVREWLIVLRTERGFENMKGIHGLTLPGVGKFYEDEDMGMLARMHLKALTGTTPKPWETDEKYLSHAAPQVTQTVNARIVKPPGAVTPQRAHAEKYVPPRPADPLGWMDQ